MHPREKVLHKMTNNLSMHVPTAHANKRKTQIARGHRGHNAGNTGCGYNWSDPLASQQEQACKKSDDMLINDSQNKHSTPKRNT